jgi:hypothetical protein
MLLLDHEGPNQYESTVSCVNRRVPYMPKPEQLSRVPPWQAISGKTSADSHIMLGNLQIE